MNTYQSNTYRKYLGWLNFEDEQNVQQKEQVMGEQSYIPISVPYTKYQINSNLSNRENVRAVM